MSALEAVSRARMDIKGARRDRSKRETRVRGASLGCLSLRLESVLVVRQGRRG